MPHLKLTSPMAENMKDNFESLPKDCTLVCRDGVVSAHRVALSWASPTFLRMLTHNRTGKIFLPQFDVQDIQQIVELIYGRSITVTEERVINLVDCAKHLEISAFQF